MLHVRIVCLSYGEYEIQDAKALVGPFQIVNVLLHTAFSLLAVRWSLDRPVEMEEDSGLASANCSLSQSCVVLGDERNVIVA